MTNHPLNIKREKDGLKPANVLLLRGCGIKIKTEPFNDKYKTKAASICPTAIIAGIVISLGIDRYQIDRATGDYHTDLIQKAKGAYDILYKKMYEFCFLHVKGYDEAGHDGLLDMRLDFVKRIDRMIEEFISLSKDEEDDSMIVVTGDHSTPMYKGDHSCEPVPFVISTRNAYVHKKPMFLCDDCTSFDEISCGKGVLGRFTGEDVMSILFKIKFNLSLLDHPI